MIYLRLVKWMTHLDLNFSLTTVGAEQLNVYMKMIMTNYYVSQIYNHQCLG